MQNALEERGKVGGYRLEEPQLAPDRVAICARLSGDAPSSVLPVWAGDFRGLRGWRAGVDESWEGEGYEPVFFDDDGRLYRDEFLKRNRYGDVLCRPRGLCGLEEDVACVLLSHDNADCEHNKDDSDNSENLEFREVSHVCSPYEM